MSSTTTPSALATTTTSLSQVTGVVSIPGLEVSHKVEVISIGTNDAVIWDSLRDPPPNVSVIGENTVEVTFSGMPEYLVGDNFIIPSISTVLRASKNVIDMAMRYGIETSASMHGRAWTKEDVQEMVDSAYSSSPGEFVELVKIGFGELYKQAKQWASSQSGSQVHVGQDGGEGEEEEEEGDKGGSK